MSLNRCENKALHAPDPHTESQQLHGKGFTGTAGPDDVQIPVLMLFGVKKIEDAKRAIIPVDSQQHPIVVGYLIARIRIYRGRPTGQNIPACPSLQSRIQKKKRHR